MLEMKGNNMEEILDFYLKNHDFQVFVNKGSQVYGKTRDKMLSNATVREVYREMQKGGCNEERNNGGTNPICSPATRSVTSCET